MISIDWPFFHKIIKSRPYAILFAIYGFCFLFSRIIFFLYLYKDKTILKLYFRYVNELVTKLNCLK